MATWRIFQTAVLGAIFLTPAPAGAEIRVGDQVVETKASAACALLVSPASQRYIDCGNGTVYDVAAGLFWLANASCALPGITQSWASAMATVASIRHGLDCDFDGSVDLADGSQREDWRLPTRDDLQALIAAPSMYGCLPPLFNDPGTGCFSDGPTAFSGVLEATGYWSSNADEAAPSKAWRLLLSSGNLSSVSKSTALAIWPVRDALPHELTFAAEVESAPVETKAEECLPQAAEASQRYVDCGNGTVLDTVTDLLWLGDATCGQLPFLAGGQGDWIDAMGSVARLADGLCGLSDGSQPGDWRLASPSEWSETSERAVALGCSEQGAKDPPALTDTAGTGCLDDGMTLFSGVLEALPNLLFWTNRSSFSPVSTDFSSALAFRLRRGNSSLLTIKTFAGAYAWPVRPREGDS